MASKLTLKKIVDEFDMKVLSGNDRLTTNTVNVYGLNRAGLELTGFFIPGSNNSRRIVLLSSKESAYISQFNEETRSAKYDALMQEGIPGIIITQKYGDVDTITKVAKKHDFPLMQVNVSSTSEFTQKILDYFDNFFAPTQEVHGSLVNIYGQGVLITGKSGIGKSEMVIELVKSNHLFVGDDRIIITNKSSILYGKSSPVLQNLIEVRGIGIMDMAKTNGYQSIMDITTIDLVVDLFQWDGSKEDTSERLDSTYDKTDILGVKVPYIRIPVSSGRNVSTIVEAAVSQLKLVKSGNAENIVELMDKRITQEQEEESGN
ncbi:HPr(Ser) kinase/phosphatase [Mesoplasma lactucae]|uniref:HPr(Ser) kinase/phosphatase n=1 Tax=Mesoplasma lactucae ATCC 49193 TaxID=81460 RepID=A0A291ISB5_9MOLU|nr:HPr(Ser) kinase/phosphatase [Mesoplasma lactucae]ATG97640.1 HPr(Ser) kinase/phosphatase [Mesoplasma lactucae ATCC 49193]ATZ19897.1 HPr kinase/phosphorylase [Mesoplasma lactucae ATCC 49193]MCL8216760.1 HPr kinase/phosphorylase [Mesoplasma lactucae ATCC 49193]